ncbi:MAG: protein kinase [Gemmatimonadales bacterium]
MPDPDSSPETDLFRERLEQALGSSFRIERELGGGGMSRVFLAEETALHRRVVVKVLSAELLHDLSTERFAREILLAARLQHPNIVPVLASGAAANVPYFTMPFIAGESLRARLVRLPSGERLPQQQAMDILRDVARALNYAHGQGVLHRDIKPENVLLGNDAAMVADFGVAKALVAARTEGSRTGTGGLTQGGMAIGTPAYMAPEQAAGDPAVDHRADIYSWGVLAYELLSGAHPFADRRSALALVTAHLVEAPKPMQDAVPEVPEAINRVVMQCLSKHPDERPGSAATLLSTLGRVTAEEHHASPGTRARRTTLPLQSMFRRGVHRLVPAMLVIAMITLGVIILRQGPPAPGAPVSVKAYAGSAGFDLYLVGKVRVATENRADNEAAIRALQGAIEADPGLAPAYATLARAYTIQSFFFASDSDKEKLLEDAEVAVEKALSLDPRLAEAHFARGLLLWTPSRRFPHEQAIRAYRQAITLDSTLDEPHHQLGLVYAHIGLLDQAQAEIEKALTINPGNTLARFRLGVLDLYRGDYERAYATFNSTPLERNPSLWAFQIATALFHLGRTREATQRIDQFLADHPMDEGGVGHSVRAMVLAKAGARAGAEAAIATAIHLGRTFGHFHHTAYNIASAYALLGDRARGVEWLQSAADEGFPCYPLFASDPHLESLRADTRFAGLMEKLQREWRQRERSF